MATSDAVIDKTSRPARSNRRGFLKVGGGLALGAGAAVLAACTPGSSSGGAASSSSASAESLLDRWTRTKKARLGVDLGFKPLQFKDPATGKPTGYQMELTQQMMTDLGVTPDYVEIPFGQLIAGQVAGKFDMMGISATILPSRALQGWFADIPCFYEATLVLLKAGSTISDKSQLNSPNIKISVLQGSAQESTGRTLFPKAQFVTFANFADAVNEVVVGRADAQLQTEPDTAATIVKYPQMRILSGGALFVDADSYFMPPGDEKLHTWVNNWLRYQATHQLFLSLWEKWIVPTVGQAHLPTTVVGFNGAPEPFQT